MSRPAQQELCRRPPRERALVLALRGAWTGSSTGSQHAFELSYSIILSQLLQSRRESQTGPRTHLLQGAKDSNSGIERFGIDSPPPQWQIRAHRPRSQRYS